MLRVLLPTGLFAGFVAAVIYSLAQFFTTIPLIHQAERYEVAAEAGHGHGGEEATAGHRHGGEEAEAWAPADGLERSLFTALSNIVAGVGFAFVLVAAMIISGGRVDGRRGLLWGLAGFAVFAFAPAVGLPPELPASAAADLGWRQAWWWGTVVATALGLGLLVFTGNKLLKAAGIAVLLLPHLIGAPHPAGGEAGASPPELAAHFAVMSLATAAVFWLVLGWTTGSLYQRFQQS